MREKILYCLRSALTMDQTSAPGSSRGVSRGHQHNPADSSTTIRVDEECHNEYYLAMRSGDIKHLETLTSKHSGDHSRESQELEDILAGTYEELKLKNVALTDETELYVGSRLLDLRFFETSFNETKNVITDEDTKQRVTIVIEEINRLNKYSGEEEFTEQFLVICKYIAQNIHILKRQVKSTYDCLPWEEIEFCLIAYVKSKMGNDEISYISRSVLTKGRILKHLEKFSNCLDLVCEDLYKDSKPISTDLPQRNRDGVIENIIEKAPFLKELYNDYKLIRDIYSLEIMKYYIDLALIADHEKKDGQLVIIRALQVIGEHLKNTLESPKMSSSTAELLLMSLPRRTSRILTKLRNSLSHTDSLSNRIAIEENSDVDFFLQIQSDITTISNAVFEIIFANKIKIIQANLMIIANSEEIDQMKELAQVLNVNKMLDTISETSSEVGSEKLEVLMEKLVKIIQNQTLYEKDLINKIMRVINDKNKKLSNAKIDYILALKSMAELAEIINGTVDINTNTVIGIKYRANKLLNKLNPRIEPQSFNNIITYTLDIVKSVKARTDERLPSELIRTVYEINHLVYYEMGNVKQIEEFLDKLNQSQMDKEEIENRNGSDNQDPKFHLGNKLSLLKELLNTNGFSDESMDFFPEFKTNKKLQALIEMLLLDILEILNISEKKLCNNILYFDDISPLLTGKQLRNHLAHRNFINELLTFEHSAVTILNARKLTMENCTPNNIKIGKLVTRNSLYVKKIFEKNLGTVSNQVKMFESIAEGNVEKFNLLVSSGADILGRSSYSWTALHYAAKGSNVEFVRFLIDQKIPVDAKDNFGRTPLHIASVNGKYAIVKFLIEEGSVGTDDIDSSGKTALHLAAQNGYSDTVEVLLNAKASTNLKDESGLSPLHWAVRNNYKDVAVSLFRFERHVDSNEAWGGFTPLHIAAEFGRVELLKYILARNANVNARADNGAVPLHAAALNGHLEVVENLIFKGAYVNAKSVNGRTVLHNAAENGNVEIVKVLLQHGAKVNAVDDLGYASQMKISKTHNLFELDLESILRNTAVKSTIFFGETPLHLAAAGGHIDVVRLLIENQCNINAKSHTGFTALHLCAQSDDVAIMKMLLIEEATVEVLDYHERTPLHIAAANGRIDTLGILLSNCADINAKDGYGMSVLHFGSRNGSKDLVKMLIDNKAEVNIADKDNMTPLHIAVQESTNEVVQALVHGGADIRAIEKNGLTALHLAVKRGKQEIVQTLIRGKRKLFNANIEVECKLGYTPMHTAAMYGHLKIIQMLIKKGAKFDLPDKKDDTPLCHAIRKKYVEVSRILVEKGANVNFESGRPFSLAVESGYKDMVIYLLKNTDVEINRAENLHVAALRGHRSIVELLLEHGAEINAVSDRENVTPLHLAVTCGHTDVVELLLKRKASVNIESDNGTALHIAANLGFTNIANNLLENGADTYVTNVKGRTAIELAVQSGYIEIVNLLLHYKPKSIHTKFGGRTLLHIAAQKGELEIIKYLIERRAKMHAKDVKGAEAIHIAAESGHVKIIEFFLSHKVCISVVDASGRTLLHYAVSGCQRKVVEYLVQQKVDINVSDFNGSKPIHDACSHNVPEMVELLLNNGAYYDANNNLNRKPLDITKDEKIIRMLQTTKIFLGAANQGNALEVEKSLNEGACINAKSVDDENALHIAARKGKRQIVNLLLSCNANPNIPCKAGCMDLHFATSHTAVAKALLSKGAIYDALNNDGKTPSDVAVNKEIVDLLKLIDDSYANVRLGNTKVLDYLNDIDIETLKAIMNARNKRNETLIVAAILNNFPAIDELKNVSEAHVSSDISRAHELSSTGEFQEAIDVLSKASNTRSEIFNLDNPAILDIKKHIGGVLSQQQKYQEAFDLLVDIYSKQKYILGKNHKDTLSTRSDVAWLHHTLGKHEKALKVYEKVYTKQIELLGTTDFATLKSQANMALVLNELGRYDEALDNYYKVLAISKHSIGMVHQLFLVVKHGIAIVLYNQGKHKEALSLFDEVYEGRKTTLGPFHMDTLSTLNNKISVWLSQRSYEKALGAYKDFLEIQKKELGPTNICTLVTQKNIGYILFNTGKLISAHEISTDTLRKRIEIFGPNHPDLLDDRNLIRSIEKIFKFKGGDHISFARYCLSDFNNAARSGDETLVQSFVDRGFDVNTRDRDGRTPLFYAVDRGHRHIVELLLFNGADITVVAIKGNILHTAASKGNKEIVNVLLKHLKFVVGNKLNGFIDARDNVTGSTSMHVAAKNGSEEIVKSLLEYGAIYNSLDYNQQTPLDVAKDVNVKSLLNFIHEFFVNAKIGDENIIIRLSALEADERRCILNARDVCGKTLIQTALAEAVDCKSAIRFWNLRHFYSGARRGNLFIQK